MKAIRLHCDCCRCLDGGGQLGRFVGVKGVMGVSGVAGGSGSVASSAARDGSAASALLLPGMGLALPGGQAKQDVLLELPVEGLNVPARHGVYVWRTVAAPSAAQ